MNTAFSNVLTDIPVFFTSYMGMYIAQSIMHALVAAIIVDRSIQAWKITSPLVRQRFRFIVIIFPFFSFILFQLFNPERSTLAFRFEALFDVSRWLTMELWGKVSFSLILVVILIITSLVTFFQELLPIIKHTLESKKAQTKWKIIEEHPAVSEALQHLSLEKPDVFIIDDDDESILFSSTGKKSAVFLSKGLVDLLNQEELQAALAHEIAHIRRSKRPHILLLYFLRVLLFFNPVVLVEFRKVVQEEEKICDDLAVNSTQNPHALAQSLKKLYHTESNLDPLQLANPTKFRSVLEDYGQTVLIRNRITRLEQGLEQRPDSAWVQFTMTFIVILLINYFVV